MRFLRLSFICLLFVLTACQSQAATVPAKFTREGEAVSPSLELEVAQTEEARRAGLMYRRDLESDAGMLFIFPRSEARAFWMKNTYIALDIVYLNDRGVVLEIHPNCAPFSEERIYSKVPARFVLEVPGGSSNAWGLNVGDVLESPVIASIDAK